MRKLEKIKIKKLNILGTHYGLPLFLFLKKGCMVIVKKERKRGKEKKRKEKKRKPKTKTSRNFP
jgi:hypothetical protein